MQISTAAARGIFTKKLIAVYKERTVPTGFLRSFFQTKESNTKQISIEVQRGTEKIAVDVERGTEGNRNQFSKSSEKIFVPPFYHEYFDAVELDFYDRLFTQDGTVDEVTFNQWLDTVVEKLGMLQDKIERAYEVQCKQVLEDGIVTLTNGDNIDFKRKAGSLVAYSAGRDWSIGTVDPRVTLEDAGNFIRKEGKAAGDVYNAILGSEVYNALINNPIFQDQADNRRISLDEIRMPQRSSTGATLHGQVSAGSYKFNIWTYPQFYDDDSGDGNPYIDPKKIIVLPEMPKFVLGFAAVPQLIGAKADVGAGIAGKRGAFLIGEHLDQRNTAHIIDIKSAGVAIPVSIDMIYTEDVLT